MQKIDINSGSLYSDRREFEGFTNAALSDRYPTVNIAMKRVAANPIRKVSGPIVILYANPSRNLFITYHDRGAARKNPIRISRRYSFEKSNTILSTDAPSTLRTPISFVFWFAMNVANPNRPRHPIKIAIQENTPSSVDILCSLS
jgi:hypothetical protein